MQGRIAGRTPKQSVLAAAVLLIAAFTSFPHTAAAIPAITSVHLEGGCAEQGRSLAITGQGFGKQAGKLELRRGGQSYDLQLLSWADTRVSATIVAALTEGQTYELSLRPAAGRESSVAQVRSCGGPLKRQRAAPGPPQGGPQPAPVPPPALGQGAADLVVALTGPGQVAAGGPLGPKFRVEARNVGTAPAPGTTGKTGAAGGFRIRLELTEDTGIQPAAMLLAKNLLVNGEISMTGDLAPGRSRVYTAAAAVPGGIGEGRYWLCARIDDGDRVAESDEGNNSSCLPVRVLGGKSLPAGETGPKFAEPVERPEAALPEPFPMGEPRLPRDEPSIRLLSAEMSLRVNGELGFAEPVSVSVGGPLRVEWDDVTAGSFGGTPDGIHPRVRYGPFPDGDCSDGPDSWAGDLAIDESRWYVGADLPAGSTGELALPTAIFRPDQYYYFKGCVRTADAAGAVSFHDTNQVEVRYGEPLILAGTFIATPAPVWENIPDLVVRDITMSRAGTHLTVWFGVNPSRPGLAPPPGSFSYGISVVEPDRLPRVHFVAQSLINIRDFSLLGYGAVVTVPLAPALRALDSLAVTAFVHNTEGGPGVIEVRYPLEIPASHYRESNYRNNSLTKLFRLRADAPLPDLLQGLVRESGGNGWAVMKLSYTLQSQASAPLRLGLADVGDTPDAPPRVQCTSAAGLPVVPAQRGVNRTARFVCVRPGSSTVRGDFGVAELRSAEGGPLLTRALFPVDLRWGAGPPTPMPFGNLAPGGYRHAGGEGGRGGDVSLIVANTSADFRVASSTALFQVREPGPARPGSVLFERLLEVPALGPSGESVHLVRIPAEVPTEGRVGRFVTDYRGVVLETDEHDNSAQWTIGVDAGRGRLVLGSSHLGTGVRYENIRNGWCWGARGGALPSRFVPAPGTVSPGLVERRDDGIFCDETERWRLQGYVAFPLARLPRAEIAGAVMRFRGRDVANEGCPPHQVIVRVLPAVPGWDWRGAGSLFRLPDSSGEGVLAGGGCPGASEEMRLESGAGGWAVDVGRYVSCVRAGELLDRGLEFVLGTSRGSLGSKACVKSLGDFTLEIDFR